MVFAQTNTVKGYIEGLSDDIVLVMVVSLDNFGIAEPVQDTIQSKNGHLEYRFPDDGAYGLSFSFTQLYTRNRPSGGVYASNNTSLTLFAEQGTNISFEGSFNSAGLSNITVSDSKLNLDFSYIQNDLYEIYKNEIKEEMALEQAMLDRNKDEEDIGWANRRERNNLRRKLFISHIMANLDDPLSAFLVTNLPLDSVSLYYDKLGENARNSIFRGILDARMENYRSYIATMKSQDEIIVGIKAPDFTLEDIDGKPFSLSSVRDKYVVIYFWGSWCGPCISGIPRMKATYEKYKDMLEIIGVACNETSVNVWRDAVKQHELPWINVYNDNWSAVNVKYGVDGYPTKIIIDSEGTIFLRENGEGDNFYAKLESAINQ